MISLLPTRTETDSPLLTTAQLRIEIARCEYCAEKPCLEACPCHCSPADFIMAVRQGAPSDYRRATAVIMSMNPLFSDSHLHLRPSALSAVQFLPLPIHLKPFIRGTAKSGLSIGFHGHH